MPYRTYKRFLVDLYANQKYLIIAFTLKYCNEIFTHYQKLELIKISFQYLGAFKICISTLHPQPPNTTNTSRTVLFT